MARGGGGSGGKVGVGDAGGGRAFGAGAAGADAGAAVAGGRGGGVAGAAAALPFFALSLFMKGLSELEASTGAHKVTNAKQQAPPRRCGGTQTHIPIVVRPLSRQEALFPRCPGRRNGRALRHVDDSSPPRRQPGRFSDVIL